MRGDDHDKKGAAQQDLEEEKRADEEFEYHALRHAIARHCMGDKGALSQGSVDCLQEGLFGSCWRRRLLRKLRRQHDNICDLPEEEYERLRGQEVLQVHLPSGLIAGPLPGRKCRKLATTAPESWIHLAHSLFQLGLSSANLPRLILRHARNPLRFLPFPAGLNGALMHGIILSVLHSYPTSGAALMAMDALHFFMHMMPQYSLRDDCLDRHGLHPIPARYIWAGGLVSSLIVGIMYAGVQWFTVDSAIGLGLISDMRALHLASPIVLGAVLAASHGWAGITITTFLKNVLQRIAYTVLHQLQRLELLDVSNSLWRKILKLTRIIALPQDSPDLDSGNLDGWLENVALVVLKEGMPHSDATGVLHYDAGANDDVSASTDDLRRYIENAAEMISKIVAEHLPAEEKSKFLDAAYNASNMTTTTDRNLFSQVHGVLEAVDRFKFDALSGLGRTTAQAGAPFSDSLGGAFAGATLVGLRNALPKSFAGRVFLSVTLKVRDDLECRVARDMYSHAHRRRHHLVPRPIPYLR